jgi:hypothetical protein
MFQLSTLLALVTAITASPAPSAAQSAPVTALSTNVIYTTTAASLTKGARLKGSASGRTSSAQDQDAIARAERAI